jgi:hypothetical protein
MVRYPLLEAINKQWIVGLQLASSYILVVGAATSLVLGAWRHELMGLGFGTGVAVSLAMTAYASYAFYNLVQCPACGNRLNRFKNGRRVPAKQAYSQLAAGHRCRHCGWQPSVGA